MKCNFHPKRALSLFCAKSSVFTEFPQLVHHIIHMYHCKSRRKQLFFSLNYLWIICTKIQAVTPSPYVVYIRARKKFFFSFLCLTSDWCREKLQIVYFGGRGAEFKFAHEGQDKFDEVPVDTVCFFILISN